MDNGKGVNLGEYVTAEEAGRIAALTSRRIRQLVNEPDPPIEAYKIAGRWFVNRDSLYLYLAKEGG